MQVCCVELDSVFLIGMMFQKENSMWAIKLLDFLFDLDNFCL